MTTFKHWLKGIGKYCLAIIASGGIIGWLVGGSNGLLLGLAIAAVAQATYAVIAIDIP